MQGPEDEGSNFLHILDSARSYLHSSYSNVEGRMYHDVQQRGEMRGGDGDSDDNDRKGVVRGLGGGGGSGGGKVVAKVWYVGISMRSNITYRDIFLGK